MSVTGLAQDDVTRMRDQLFFEGPERSRRLSRFWLLLLLSTVIASAGVVSDSTATVIGAMIVAIIDKDRASQASGQPVRQVLNLLDAHSSPSATSSRNPDPTRHVLLDRKVDRLSCGEG